MGTLIRLDSIQHNDKGTLLFVESIEEIIKALLEVELPVSALLGPASGKQKLVPDHEFRNQPYAGPIDGIRLNWRSSGMIAYRYITHIGAYRPCSDG